MWFVRIIKQIFERWWWDIADFVTFSGYISMVCQAEHLQCLADHSKDITHNVVCRIFSIVTCRFHDFSHPGNRAVDYNTYPHVFLMDGCFFSLDGRGIREIIWWVAKILILKGTIRTILLDRGEWTKLSVYIKKVQIADFGLYHFFKILVLLM